VTDDDLARLVEAGVYDPAAIDAMEQRRVLDQLVTQGITVDDLATAHRLGTIVVRAFEHLLLPGERATVAEAAGATGLEVEQVLTIRRAWGLSDPPVDRPSITPAEVDAMRYVAAMAGFVGADLALHVARIMGTAMSRLAEAEIALMRSRVEAPMRDRHESGASMLGAYRNVLDSFLPQGLRVLDVLHRAYLVALGQRYSEWALPPSDSNVVDTVVGFVDMTESTRLVERTDLSGLDRALTTFERVTSDFLAAAGASIVKRLGDGVMFVTPDCLAACRVALDLVDAFRDDPTSLPVRVGLAAGQVAALRGDFFGPAVHLAARIVDVAPSSSVLVTDEVRTRAHARGPYVFEPAGAQVLAGFVHSTILHRLARASAT
jgi:class 3 adenylate cyclase